MGKKKYIEGDESKPRYLMDIIRKELSKRITPDVYVDEGGIASKIKEFINPGSENEVDDFSQNLWNHFLGQDNDLTIENDTVRLPDNIKKILGSAINGGLEKERASRIKQRDSLDKKISRMIDKGQDVSPDMINKLDTLRAKVNWIDDTLERVKTANEGKPTVFNEYDFNMDKEGELTDLSGLSSFTMFKDEEGKINVRDKYDFYSPNQSVPVKAVTTAMDKVIGTPFPIADKFKEGGDTLVSKQKHIYKRLVEDYQLPSKQAIAVIANLTHESGLNTEALGDKGASFGIQQWKGKRRDNLYNFAKKRGNTVPTLDDQIDFLMNEYNNGQAFQFNLKGQNLYQTKKGKGITEASDYFQFSKADFDNADNLYDATIAWNQGVGRPHKKWAMNDRRYEIAKNLAGLFNVQDETESKYSEQGYSEEALAANMLPNVDVVAESPSTTQDNSNQQKEDFFEKYGKTILAQLLANNTNNNITQIAKEQEVVAKEVEEQSSSNNTQDDRLNQLISSFLPNIQLNIKGVTQIGRNNS